MTRIDLRFEKMRGTQSAMGAGFVALDIVEGQKNTFAAAGGSCGNVMSILSWMGWRAIQTGRLGTDQASEFIVEEFDAIGVNTDHLIQDNSISTPIVIQKFVESKDGGRSHRFSLTCPDCKGWLPRFRAMTLKQADPIVESDLRPATFYFDRVTPASLKLAKWAKDRGALVMFEPASINDERAFQKAVDLCHILKYSDERLGHIPDLEETQNPKVIIKTLGEAGLQMRWRNRWSRINAFEAPVFEDAAGSGDWCTAGILHRLGNNGSSLFQNLKKSDLERAIRFGQAIAAINCGFEGARGLMTYMDHDALNSALRVLVSAEHPDKWEFSEKEKRILPARLCDLCAQPEEPESKKRRA
ncbi:PfkB family carbohydrate kinase [Sphingorhabdus sp. EL138]|uniref:PfkB family carbohydrate kinase n=1 Tax=Sphingorhabdus sp. EL138 TaxID=2073156 RepID=UPI0013A546E7|nr:PfkB family carbohydrate kinase [Sphingorhabdus sp. EL138]